MLASKARLCGDVGVPAECMQTQQGDVPLQLVPPIFSMLVRTTSMPTPRPDTLVTFSAVEKPALKMYCWIC